MIRNLRSFAILLFLVFLVMPPVIAQQVQKPNTVTYDEGITLFEKGLYEKSADELAHFVKNNPGHKLVESAQFYRARALGQTDSAHADTYYQRFITRHPSTVFAQKLLLDLANQAKKGGASDKALTYYRRALKQGTNNKQAARIYYWIAETQAQKKENVQARATFLHLADAYPKSDWAPKALYARGRLFLSESEFDSSSTAFELLKKRYPNDKMTRQIGIALGESYYQQRKYEKAVQALKNGLPYLQGDEKNKAVYLIAESYNAQNKFDQASSHYLQYINLTKGTDKERAAHYGLGWVYHKQKIYHWAADEFGKAAKGRDTLARKALYYKAVNEKLGGRYKEALETFESFGKRYKKGLWIEEAYYEWAITAYEAADYPKSIQTLLYLIRSDINLKHEGKTYTLLGEAYFANKEYTRALQAFDAADKLTGIDPAVKRQARFQKAWVQYRNGAYKQSLQGFKDVYEDAPDTKLGKQALFWSADSHYNLQQYGPASRQFSLFIRQNPDNKLVGAARYSLGWSYFKMGQYQKAIPPFDSFLKHYNPPSIALFPYDTDTRLRLADSYYGLSKYDKAIQIYQKSVGDDPGGDYALFQIGNAYYRAEQTYQAVTTFRKFLRTFPKSRLREQAQYNIAYIYLNTGNYEQAIEEFRTAIKKYPGTSWAARSQYNIGDAYYNAGEFSKAITAYRKVMSNYPNSDYVVEAANGIEYAQQSSKGNKVSKDTTSALDKYLQDNPQNSSKADQLRYQQAESLVQSGDYIKAIPKLEQYVRTSNNDRLLPNAYLHLAKAYEQTDRQAKAVTAYQTLANTYSSSKEAPAALAALGRLKYAQKDFQASFDNYQKLLKKGGNYRLQAHVGMGDALLAQQKTDAAKKEYQSALRINSSYDAAKVGLAKAALKQGDVAQAQESLTKVASENTTEAGARAQYLLGVAKQQKGDFKGAIEEYAKVQVLYKVYNNWVAKSMLKSAECYLQLGNKGEASRTLNALIKKYPRTPEARSAQQMLQSN